MSDPGLVSLRREDRIATITIERPEALNAISGATADALSDRFREVSSDPDTWAVVLTGAGEKAFCVGADLKERATFSLEDFYDNRKRIRRVFASVRSTPQPTIASIFGFALGGGFELALSCDLVIAAEETKLGLPEARVGLLPAGGGTQLLARKAGPSRAKEMIFTGRRIEASEALNIGLVSRVVPRDQLALATKELAVEVCDSSPIAVREAKKAIDAALGIPLDEGIELEEEGWKRVVSSEDRAEGISAFLDKREPRWSNR